MILSQKQAIRSTLDGSWTAVFGAIEDSVEDVADVEPIVETIRTLITAERFLADDEIRHLTDEQFKAILAQHSERIAKHREGLGL